MVFFAPPPLLWYPRSTYFHFILVAGREIRTEDGVPPWGRYQKVALLYAFDDNIDHKQVVITWTPTAHPYPILLPPLLPPPSFFVLLP